MIHGINGAGMRSSLLGYKEDFAGEMMDLLSSRALFNLFIWTLKIRFIWKTKALWSGSFAKHWPGSKKCRHCLNPQEAFTGTQETVWSGLDHHDGPRWSGHLPGEEWPKLDLEHREGWQLDDEQQKVWKWGCWGGLRMAHGCRALAGGCGSFSGVGNEKKT